MTGIEPLENRIAPATLLTDYRTLIYLNADGELVNVKFSSPVFSAADAQTRANAVFDFDTGGVTVASAFTNIDGPQQLQLLDLTALKDVNPNPAEGVSITISTTKMDGRTAGTSFADVGFLKAVNPAKNMALALGAVSIQGDLGRIEAGNANTAVAIKSLTVQSMERARPRDAGCRGLAGEPDHRRYRCAGDWNEQGFWRLQARRSQRQ